jgi:DNA-directed RNA polymerase subunit RPC12/RpoP
MNEFLELVKEHPDPKLWKKGIFCPYCKSKDVQTFGTRTTLVGYFGKDLNHTHTECRCNKCNKEFTRETKGYDNVWFTDPRGKVLLGIPYCFEGYIYTCKHCGGDVIRVWYDVKTDEPLKPIQINGKDAGFILSTEVKDGKSIPRQYPVFRCKECGKEIKSTNDYMYAS